MKTIKRSCLIAAIVLLAVFEIVIYSSQHFYYRANETSGPGEKIKILKKACQLYPFNDLVYYELGKAYFEMSKHNPIEREKNVSLLQKSVESYRRSIRINPTFQFSHFRLFRSLFYLNLFALDNSVDYLYECKNAASLVNFNSQIYYEAGKFFLSTWSDLSEEDKDFAIDILKEVMGAIDREKVLSLLHAWELNVKDFEMLVQILPKIPEVYRLCGDFLGERSLSLYERQKILNEYYSLEFEEARSVLRSGENLYCLSQLDKAVDEFRACLIVLSRIRFSKNIEYKTMIDRNEFVKLRKSALLSLSKCLIELGKDWSEYKGYLEKFLSYDHKMAEVNELASYLENWRVIESDRELNADGLDRLFFISLLRFKQNRFRDVIKLESTLKGRKNADSEKDNNLLMKILWLIGDSYQKIGILDDAEDSYREALQIDPDNIEILLQMRSVYERLNNKQKIRDINSRIDEMMSDKNFIHNQHILKKGEKFYSGVLFDGREIYLDFRFGDEDSERNPLVLVIFNDEVIWEGYLNENDLSIKVKTRVGTNTIELTGISNDVALLQFWWRDV